VSAYVSGFNLQRAINGEMAEENTTAMNLSDANATTEEIQFPRRFAATFSFAFLNDMIFHFQVSAITIGAIGTAANALILYAMVASKQHKKHLLIFNQNALDLFSCFCLVTTYPVKFFNIPLAGSPGYWLCVLIMSDLFVWLGNVGSVINLAAITIERYLKVVHGAWTKKNLSRRMIYSAMAFAWLTH